MTTAALTEPPSLTEALETRFALRDRALVLRTIASRWGDLIDTFSPEWDKVNTGLLGAFLRQLVKPYAHDSIADELLIEFMLTLAKHLKALDDYQTYGSIPDSLDDEEAYGNAPAEVLVSLMEGDIDLSLWFLLHGEKHPCQRCRRTHAHVWTWRAANYPASIFCDSHRGQR